MPRISELEIIERGTQRALSVKSEVKLKDLNTEIEKSREKVYAYLQLMEEYPSGSFFVIYHSFSKENVVMEAGFTIQNELEGKEDVQPTLIIEGLYLTALHLGAQNEIPKIYKEMDQWLEENQFETTGVSEEVHDNHISDSVLENQLVTKILIPIQKIET